MNASAWVRDWLRTSVRYLAGVAGLGLFLGLAPAAMAVVEGTPCTSDPQTITYGSLTICDIEALGDNDTYNFSATVGQTFYVQVTRHGGGTPYFCLYRVEGTLSVLVGCAGGAYPNYNPASLTHTATQTTTYKIRVSERDDNAILTYALSLERVAPPSASATLIKDADLLSDEINPLGDNDLLYFNVCGASSWYVQQTRTGGGTPYFCLYRPDGTLVGCNGGAYPNYNPASLTLAADQTGAYTIRATERDDDATLTYNITLSCLAGDCRNVCCEGGDCSQCFESGTGAIYMKVCVSGDGTLEEFQSPAGYQQLPVAADNREGYALCTGTKLRGYDAGLDQSGFGPATIIQPGGPGTLPLSIVRETTDGVFQLTQTYTRDTGEKDFTVAMSVKNLSAATVYNVKLTRYFNGDIDNTSVDDLYDRTLDTVWGTQGAEGHGLALFAKSGNVHATRIEYASAWDPQGGGMAAKCDVAGIDPAVPDDYAGRITYSLAAIAPGASKTVSIVYRRQ